MKGGPEAIARATEVMANRGRVKARVDAGKEDDKVLGNEIRDELVRRGEKLGLRWFPRGRIFNIGIFNLL